MKKQIKSTAALQNYIQDTRYKIQMINSPITNISPSGCCMTSLIINTLYKVSIGVHVFPPIDKIDATWECPRSQYLRVTFIDIALNKIQKRLIAIVSAPN